MHKQGFAKKVIAMFLAGTMAALGCVGTPESDTDVGGEVAPEKRQRVTMEFAVGEHQAVLELDRATDDDMFRGTMTVTGADGIPHIQDVEYPADEPGGAAMKIVTDADGSRWLDVNDQRLKVTSYVKADDGIDITFLSPDGVEFFFHQSGGGDLYTPAHVVLGIVGIAVCGVVVLANIAACAWRDRCWSYNLTGGLTAVCTGSCVACAPTPTPTASTTPQPSATVSATPTPSSTPVPPTSTPSSSPSSSPS